MIRLFAEYDSKLRANGAPKKYRIDIIQEGYSGTSEEIKCTATGIVISRESDHKQFPQFVLPTHCTVSFDVRTQNQFDFFDGLGTISELGLILKITDRDSGGIEYIGKLLPDLLTLADDDLANGLDVSIKAVDGIALLRDIPYIDSQAVNYFFQINDHKLRVEISADVTQMGHGDGSSYTLFDLVVEDPGSRYDPITGEYTSGGVTGDWSMSLIVHARPSNAFEDVTATLIKRTGAGDEILSSERVTFEKEGVTQRQILHVFAEDEDLDDLNKMAFLVEWQDDWEFLTFEKGSSVFNNIRSSKYNLKNVYGSLEVHFKNLLQAIGLHDQYGAADVFFQSIINWSESTQSTTGNLLAYLNAPYNAFITDYSTFPVSTLSCFDALDAICKSLGAFLTYEDGKYVFAQYDALIENAGRKIEYLKTFDPPTNVAYSDTQTEPKRLKPGSFTFMPSIREMSLSFKRWNTPNFLFGAWGVFPNVNGDIYTNSYVKSGNTVKFLAAVRLNNNPLPRPGYVSQLTHTFTMKLKIGDHWMKFDQLTFYISSGLVFNLGRGPTNVSWEDTLQVNTLMFPLVSWFAVAPIDLVIIGDVPTSGVSGNSNYVFDPPPASGDLEFEIDYNTTYHFDTDGSRTDTVLNLDYEWTDFQLINTDEADNIIEEIVKSSVISSGSTKSLDIPILFSDRSTLDQDPGKLQIDNGIELVDLTTVTDGVIAKPYQEFLTNFYASITLNRIRLYQGSLVVSDPLLLAIIDGIRHFAMSMQYGTAVNHQQCRTAELNKWAVTGEYIEIVGQQNSTSAGSSGTLPGSTTGTAIPPGTTDILNRFIVGSARIDNLDELAPYNFDLSLFSGLSAEEIQARTELKISGRALDYLSAQYSINFAADPVNWKFVNPIQKFEQITWKILL